MTERQVLVSGSTDFTVRWCKGCVGDWYHSLPWRSRLAWRLRNWADKVENPGKVMTYTFTLEGHVSTRITRDDYTDAICMGVSAMAKYLDDRAKEEAVL